MGELRHHRAVARWVRRAGALAVIVACALVTALGLATLPATPAAAAPVGCGYADSSANNGAYASTICWFDFTGFDEAQARSTAGQSMQVTLDGGYVATFTARFSDVAGTLPMSVERRSTPLETRFAFGSDAYRGVPGLHTLYSLPGFGGTMGGSLAFENIQIVDSLGAPVSGFSFVAADTEDNVSGESFAWSSDQPLNEIERLAPDGGWGCKAPVGLGTTDVSCAGTGVGATTEEGGKSTALLVAADTPTRFATQWITPARSGLAVGIQTANLTVVKQVSGRVDPADSFTVSITGSTATVLGTGTTGTGTSATTGTLNVLAGEQFTLTDSATVGTPANMANYDSSWSCTNTNAASTTVLPAGTELTQTVTPGAGDDITCTVTNTAKEAELTLVKSSTPSGPGAYAVGQVVTYSFLVTNTGDVTVDNLEVAETAFSGSGTMSTIVCPSAGHSLSPDEQVTCTATYKLTPADVDAGTLTNSAEATGDPVGFPSPASSGVSSTTLSITPSPALGLVKSASHVGSRAGETVTFTFVLTNLGNVSLTGPTVTETAFSGSGPMPVPVCPAGVILPGKSVTCTAGYVLTGPDVASGSLSNSATGSASAPGGATVAAASSVVVLIPDPPAAALALTGATLAWGGAAGAVLLLFCGVLLAVSRRPA
jgi:hypothetical protein